MMISINSLFSRATDPTSIQLLLAFDRDDSTGLNYFREHIEPSLVERNIRFQIIITERFGYKKLQYYYNLLAKSADADWLFVWNDDATMDTQGWDQIITSHTGQFLLLSVITHGEHPYSIFPIIPKVWLQLLGRLSRHLEVDCEVSQMAYLLDIFKRVPIYCTHYRPELHGTAPDSTYLEKLQQLPSADSNDQDSFKHPNFYTKRIEDLQRIAHYMKHVGLDTSWWDSCSSGENPAPFAKLAANDPNKQVTIGRQDEYKHA
jgi:hypothetical protein